MSLKNKGIWILAFCLLITLNLFILSKEDIKILFNNPLLSLSQLFALLGTVLLCFSFILSSKFSFLEHWFGGFDKVYKTHHLTGALAFIFLLNHPMFLIAQSLPNKKLALLYVLPSGVWSYNFGIFALWLLILFLVLTIYIKLPYHVWKKTHEYMGLPLLFASLHIFLISSDVSRFVPLKILMLSFIFTALISYIHVRFLYSRFGPKFHYVLEDFKRKEDLLEIYLRPAGKSLEFSPGQFAFLQFESNVVSLELHPFSISSDPKNKFLRFSIKISGDYTLRLRDLKKGSAVKVYGPYGKFFEKLSGCKSAVCVAGGIGITPFLGMLSNEVNSRKSKKDIALFYCGKNKGELYYHNEILNYIRNSSMIKYFAHYSSERGKLKALQILQKVGDLKNKLIFLCGPPSMMNDLKNQFLNLGVSRRNIIFEDFSFRE